MYLTEYNSWQVSNFYGYLSQPRAAIIWESRAKDYKSSTLN